MHYLVCFTYGLFRTSKGTKDSRILKLTAEEAISLPAIKKAVVNELLEYYKHSTAFESFKNELHCESITAITPITTQPAQQTIRTIEFNGSVIPINNISYYKKDILYPIIIVKLTTGEEIRKFFDDTTPGGYPPEVNRDLAFNEFHRKFTIGK